MRPLVAEPAEWQCRQPTSIGVRFSLERHLTEIKVRVARPLIVHRHPRETAMTRLNVGNVDRALRLLLGITLMALAAGGVIGAWGYLGIVPLLTGISALCPLYSLLGIATTSR
jgi:hypothetical protein